MSGKFYLSDATVVVIARPDNNDDDDGRFAAAFRGLVMRFGLGS